MQNSQVFVFKKKVGSKLLYISITGLLYSHSSVDFLKSVLHLFAIVQSNTQIIC